MTKTPKLPSMLHFKLSRNWFVVCVILGFVVGLMVGFVIPFNPSSNQSFTLQRAEISSGDGWGSMIPHSQSFSNREAYYDIYFAESRIYVIGICGNSTLTEDFSAEKGSTFKVFGAEFSVMEVNSESVVVSVRFF